MFLLLLKVVVYYYERRMIYFPDREHRGSPKDYGLKVEDVRFETRDGVNLHGWFVPAAAETAPIMLFCHGNAGNIADRLENLVLLNELGISVFIFDYRGYGRSEDRTPSEKGIYADSQGAYDYLTQIRGVSPDSLYIFGRSLGSACASYLASRNRCKGLVLETPMYNAMSLSKSIIPFLPVSRMLTIRLDNAEHTRKLRVPVLVIHGTRDEIIPYEEGEQLFMSLRGMPAGFYTIPGARHNDTWIVVGGEYSRVIKMFVLDGDFPDFVRTR